MVELETVNICDFCQVLANKQVLATATLDDHRVYWDPTVTSSDALVSSSVLVTTSKAPVPSSVTLVPVAYDTVPSEVPNAKLKDADPWAEGFEASWTFECRVYI